MYSNELLFFPVCPRSVLFVFAPKIEGLIHLLPHGPSAAFFVRFFSSLSEAVNFLFWSYLAMAVSGLWLKNSMPYRVPFPAPAFQIPFLFLVA